MLVPLCWFFYDDERVAFFLALYINQQVNVVNSANMTLVRKVKKNGAQPGREIARTIDMIDNVLGITRNRALSVFYVLNDVKFEYVLLLCKIQRSKVFVFTLIRI